VSIGWGIVGTGGVADRSVAPGIAKLPDGELVASVGSSLEKAQAFADKHGGRAYGTLEELAADPTVEIVYVATPNAMHADQVVALSAAGKHVFCDKPLATTVDDARRAVDACEQAGVKLGINFQTRHHAVMPEIKRAIAAGKIGEPAAKSSATSPPSERCASSHE
jgi:1,5-anhydro-D-fructose reductase (1,5-anhydro-D-mannitol-forming)